jgi:antitoxin Phd
MAVSQLQEAKARFGEFLDAAIKKGPQVVTRRGIEAAVRVPMEEWRRLQAKQDDLYDDAMIAATARLHGLIVATRNERDFQYLEVKVVNPFKS